MSRTFTTSTARIAAAVVLAVALAPAALATSAHATDAPPVDEIPYAEQVDIGEALRIGNPDFTDEEAEATEADADVRAVRRGPVHEPDATATPPGAIVIEVSHWQPAAADESAAEPAAEGSAAPVARLPETGPPALAVQLLIATALIALGAAMRGGPQLVAAVRR